jgi:hypothetical protein
VAVPQAKPPAVVIAGFLGVDFHEAEVTLPSCNNECAWVPMRKLVVARVRCTVVMS